MGIVAAVIGVEAGLLFIKECLNYYDGLHFVDTPDSGVL